MECSRNGMTDENPLVGETTCGTLLQKLQEIWDEVGEADDERDKMLLQIEQDCLDVYKKKVEQATVARSELLQALSNAKIELANLLSALGEKTLFSMKETASGSIKEQLAAIGPELEGLVKIKEERAEEFSGVQTEIEIILLEISGEVMGDGSPVVDESDLSVKKLELFQDKLRDLQKEKGERLGKVLGFVTTVRELCDVLGVDFASAVSDVHPSLVQSGSNQSTSISNETLARLAKTVVSLKEDKKRRLRKLQELATQLTDLWNLMDTSQEERDLLRHVTCNVSSEVEDVSLSGALAKEIIEQAEVEVQRLDKLKASRMKEIAFKKQGELEEIYSQAHIEIDPEVAREKIMELIDRGNIEPAELLADMDNQIASARAEALSRREILEKVEKWMTACEEESWLEDYNRDDNRYNASRGAHLNLKRAEKARVLVNKIPSLVESLIAKTKAWEEDREVRFSYDGVPLLEMLDEYAMLRQEREEERRRIREQKKYIEQHNNAEASPARTASFKRGIGASVNGVNGTPSRRLSGNTNQIGSKSGRRESRGRLSAPSNYVAISKDDSGSLVSGADGVSVSP